MGSAYRKDEKVERDANENGATLRESFFFFPMRQSLSQREKVDTHLTHGSTYVEMIIFIFLREERGEQRANDTFELRNENAVTQRRCSEN